MISASVRWICLVTLLCTPAFGQRRVFIARDGEQASAPSTGSVTVSMAAGSTEQFMAWLEDTGAPGGQLNAYQLILPYDATPLGASNGLVSYVDNNPGGGQGDSVFLDVKRDDWVFDDQIVPLPPNYNESPGAGIWGIFYATLTNLFTDPAGAGIRYLVEFEISTSADACGSFEMAFNITNAPLTSFFTPTGATFLIDEYQSLIVNVAPANAECANAETVTEGDTSFCTILDDPDPDVWFEYNPQCDGPVTVSTCDQADYDTVIEVFAGCGACPPGAPVATNDDGAGCTGGTSEAQFTASSAVCYTIRVGGSGGSGTGGGTLSIVPDSCFISGQCQSNGTVNPVNECEVCDAAASPTDWSPRPSGTACTPDVNECTDDVCDGAGTCDHPPVAGGTPCTPDSNDCTDDVCDGAGTCAHPPSPVGTSCFDADGNECTVDQCDGAGACANPAPDDTPCADDGNPCTDNSCQGGNCAAQPNSDPCDDGMFCNGDDTCGGGTCSVHTGDPCLPGVCDEVADECLDCNQNEDCADDGNICTDEVCLMGECTSIPNSDPCDDGIFCNGTDTCFGGTCSINSGDPCFGGAECDDVCDEANDNCNVAAGTPCTPDSNECTEDVCDGAGACGHPPAAAGLPCTDDGNECTEDECDGAGACGHPPAAAGQACTDDGNECTDDECDGAGVCDHPPAAAGLSCADDGNDCTFDECDGAGACAHPPTPAGTACDDGLPCTGTGVPGFDECDGAGGCSGPLDPSCANTCVDAADAFEGTNLANNTGFGTETQASCAFNSTADTWFVHVANCDGQLLVTTNGSDFDTVLSAYEDCADLGSPKSGDEVELACDDDGGAGLASAVVIPVLAGQDYFFRVAGFGNANGNVLLNITRLDTCFIGGTCYLPDDSNPDNACELCDPGETPDDWSPALKGTACGDAVPSDVQCDSPDSCDGSGNCESNFKPDGIPCGDPTDTDCDNPDTCNGAGACVDNFESTGFACGDPSDTDCDNPDTCDGSGGCLDNFETIAAPCGDLSDTQCDNPDSCDGLGACLDNFEGSGFACGDPTDDDCNNPDTCDGTGVCLDNFEPTGFACGSPDDTECDNPDTCNGSGFCLDNFELPATACGDPAMTECDNPDSCNGAGTCLDNFQIVGVACGDPTSNECDSSDTCDGGGACLDNFVSSGFPCGSPTNSECDNPDTCDGAGACQDNLEAAGFACGDPLDNECNDPDTCDGGGACLDNFEADGTACGDPLDNDCNDPDTCDGAGACLDNFETVGTACGDTVDNECDNPDTCDGGGACLDNFEPLGLPCGDGTNTDCDNPDTCSGAGACQDNLVPVGIACGDPTDTDCQNPDTCDGSGDCLDNAEPDGTSCTDGLFCNGDEICFGGMCNDQADPCLSLLLCDEVNDECLACTEFSDCGDLDGDGITDDACFWYECVTNECNTVARSFADLGGANGACPPDGVADNNDVFHALNCFSNISTLGVMPYPCEPFPPAAINIDAAGLGSPCCPDGVCDSNDVFAVLNTFEAQSTCSCPDACPAGPAPRGQESVLARTELVVRAPRRSLEPGDVLQVELYLMGAVKDLRGYQLHVDVSGGTRGALQLMDVSIDVERPNYVFEGQRPFQAFNVELGQVLAGLTPGGVGTPAQAYLATYTYRVSSNALGVFSVKVLHDDNDATHRTVLHPSKPNGVIAIERSTPATVTVVQDRKQAMR